MRIIKEELLIPNDQISYINGLSGDKRTNEIIKALKDNLIDYDKYVGTSDKNTNKLVDIVASIREYGWDNRSNRYLELIQELIKNNVALSRDEFVLGAKILQQNPDLKLSGNQYFLDQSSYRPLYKIKALSFLNGRQAINYGDNPEDAIKAIKGMKSQEEIENYLANWQTKSGQEAAAQTILDSIKANPENFGLSAYSDYLDEITDTDDLFSKEGQDLIRELLSHLDDSKKYSSIINNLTHAELKEHLLKEAVGDENYWSRKYRGLLDILSNNSNQKNKRYDKAKIVDFLSSIQDELSQGDLTGVDVLARISGTGIDPHKAYSDDQRKQILGAYIKKLPDQDNLDATKINNVLSKPELVDKVLDAKYVSREDFRQKLINLFKK